MGAQCSCKNTARSGEAFHDSGGVDPDLTDFIDNEQDVEGSSGFLPQMRAPGAWVRQISTDTTQLLSSMVHSYGAKEAATEELTAQSLGVHTARQSGKCSPLAEDSSDACSTKEPSSEILPDGKDEDFERDYDSSPESSPTNVSGCSSPRTPQRSMKSRMTLIRTSMPTWGKRNPDDINNVYTLAKEATSVQGTFGTIRKGTAKATGASRTVNVIPKSISAEKLANINKRIDTLTPFDHPNLVTIFAVFEDKDSMYLIMDYCEGGTLQNRMKQGILSEVKAMFVMQQVFRAVFYMHSQDVCHRDIQPRNILFSHDAKEIQSTSLIKVASLSTVMKATATQKMKKVVGRPGYMAPEMSSGSYGRECDPWSCGIVMFEILCGRLPFASQSGTDENSSRKVLSRKASILDSLFQQEDENVTQSARNLVLPLLESNPKNRLTASKALNHQWFSKAQSKLHSSLLDASVLTQLIRFRDHCPLQQATLRIIGNHSSDEDTAPCRRLFTLLDKDGDGKLSHYEVENIVAADPELCAVCPDIADIFGPPEARIPLSYTEFVAATFNREKCLTDKACRVAFRCFDKNSDGVISMSELAQTLTVGRATPEELLATFDHADKNKDEVIDFEEFKLLMEEAK